MINHNDFFKKHNIHSSITIDGGGKGLTKEFKEFMREEGYYYAYNVNPCLKGGHTIRDRHSHCIVCAPSNIRFMQRPSEDGDVYIAGSRKGKFLKIGCTSSYKKRDESLNRTKYANEDDWEILYSFKTKEAGHFENLIHKSLKNYSTKDVIYEHGGKIVVADELFKCSFDMALLTIYDLIEKNNIKGDPLFLFDDFRNSYDF